MASVYTRRFAARAGTAPDFPILFTADDLHVYVVRDIVITNSDAIAGLGQVIVSSGIQNYTLFRGEMPPNSSQHLELRQELLPSEALVGGVISTSWSVIITGYALTPP